MKINRQFNTLTYLELVHLIEQHHRFTDFNTLGLFRAILESTKLTIEQKIEVRDFALISFQKTFDFLQLKDPVTYFELTILGQNPTEADSHRVWEIIRFNQQKILERKKIRHRNFGTYSKHLCGYDTCPLDGLMIRQGSRLAESGEMHFCSDRRSYALQVKSERRKKERKTRQQIIAYQVAVE